MDQASNSTTPAAEARLVRGIRRWDLVAVAVNGIIGAGIFGLPSAVFKTIGVYSLAAFVVCAVVVALIVFCFAEVGSRFEGTGGPYLYARHAFGDLTGFEVGWLLLLARLTAFAANLNLLVEYLTFFWPGAGSGLTRVVVITSIVIALTVANLVGVRNTARVTNVFTIGKLIPIAAFIAVGLFFVNSANFTPATRPGVGQFSSAVLLLVYAFSGFEIASIPAGEIENPRKNLPMSILTALCVVTVTYVLIQVVCIGTLPELGASTRPLADASVAFIGRAGASVISAGALISIIGNLNVLVLAASRLPFAMAERGELPPVFATTHPRFRTPHISIVSTTAVMLVVTLSGTFVYAASISVIARLLAYIATCAALIAFRRSSDSPPALFKIPAATSVAVAALLLSGWLLINTDWSHGLVGASAAGFGLVVYYAYRALKRPSAK